MIVNPIDNNKYSIHSIVGRNLLKQYITNYKNGGMKRKREDDGTLYPYRDLSFSPTSKRIRTGTGRRVRSRYGQLRKMKLDYLKDKLTDLEDDRREREIIPKVDSGISKEYIAQHQEDNPYYDIQELLADPTNPYYTDARSRLERGVMSTDLFDVDRFVNKIMKKYSTPDMGPDKLIEFINREYSHLPYNRFGIDTNFRIQQFPSLKDVGPIINPDNFEIMIADPKNGRRREEKKIERHNNKIEQIRYALKWYIFLYTDTDNFEKAAREAGTEIKKLDSENPNHLEIVEKMRDASEMLESHTLKKNNMIPNDLISNIREKLRDEDRMFSRPELTYTDEDGRTHTLSDQEKNIVRFVNRLMQGKNNLQLIDFFTWKLGGDPFDMLDIPEPEEVAELYGKEGERWYSNFSRNVPTYVKSTYPLF